MCCCEGFFIVTATGQCFWYYWSFVMLSFLCPHMASASSLWHCCDGFYYHIIWRLRQVYRVTVMASFRDRIWLRCYFIASLWWILFITTHDLYFFFMWFCDVFFLWPPMTSPSDIMCCLDGFLLINAHGICVYRTEMAMRTRRKQSNDVFFFVKVPHSMLRTIVHR